MTLVYERDGRETKFQRCISSQGTGEYRIDSKLVSYDTYASRLQDLGVLASAHTGFLVFQGYVSELANKSPQRAHGGQPHFRFPPHRGLNVARARDKPHASRPPSLSGALRKDIWLGGAEGGGRAARQREEGRRRRPAVQLQQKARPRPGTEQHEGAATPPPSLLLRRRLPRRRRRLPQPHHRAFLHHSPRRSKRKRPRSTRACSGRSTSSNSGSSYCAFSASKWK